MASWHSYEYIAGKIISTNAAINFAKYFSANSELSMAAKATQCAASALVTSPVSCMAGLMATTILVANYEHIIPVVKVTANLTWEVAKTASYTSAAAVEATVGSVLYVEECISDAVMSDFTIDLSGEFAEIGILIS